MVVYFRRLRDSWCLVDSVGARTVMVTFLGNVLFPPPVEIRENPEFHDLVRMDKGHWPRSLLWHGWLPLLSGINGASPWAESPWEGAPNLLECALGRYSSEVLMGLQLPVGF